MCSFFHLLRKWIWQQNISKEILADLGVSILSVLIKLRPKKHPPAPQKF